MRTDQPYGNAARTLLEIQKFPEDEPNPPYDDVAWTWPLLYGVEGSRIDERALFDAAMEPVGEDLVPHGRVDGAGGTATGDLYLVRDTGQNGRRTPQSGFRMHAAPWSARGMAIGRAER